MRNGRWRVATNGPDWTDVRVTMGALAELHKCQCYLELAPDGPGAGGGIVVRALLVSNAPVDGLKPAEIGLSKEWPNKTGQSMTEAAFDLLYQLDVMALARWWHQEELTYGA